MSTLTIRPAAREDLPVIADIYHHYVRHSVCTFETEPRPMEQWADWLTHHNDKTPAIVAVYEGRIVGWGSLSKWNNRCAYRHSVEDSVYVRDGCHRRGVGRALLGELVRLAKLHNHRVVIAQIADHQAASETLHAAFGFRNVGCLEQVGFKFDRWIDVCIWQLLIPQ